MHFLKGCWLPEGRCRDTSTEHGLFHALHLCMPVGIYSTGLQVGRGKVVSRPNDIHCVPEQAIAPVRSFLSYLAVFCLCCTAPIVLYAQDVRLVLDEHLVLGTSQTDPNRMFGDPTFVREGKDGRIYVFDQLAMRIKIYSHRGRFVASVGERGRGSGEFNSFSTGWISEEEQILVFDQFNQRLTRLSQRGKLMDTTTLDPRILWPRDVLPYDDNYLLLYRHSNSALLVHEWDPTFTTRLDAFVQVDTITGGNPFLDSQTFFRPGHAALWNGRLVLTPPVCNGNLLQYDSDGRELLAERLMGVPPRSPPFEIVSVKAGGDLPDDATIISDAEGRRAARVHCWSIGLVPLSDGYLIHFSARQRESGKIIFVELFDQRGKLIGAHALDALAAPGDKVPAAPILVFSGIEDNRLLVVDRRSSYPLVRVFDGDVRTP